MNEVLERDGAHVDAFYYCPHHPEHGIGLYKKKCHCRKPETGMFEMAERDLPEGIDKVHSYMIGDKLHRRAGRKKLRRDRSPCRNWLWGKRTRGR